MERISDEQLVNNYKNGDVSAFEQLYIRYIKLINSISRSFFLVGGDEDDLKQEGTLGLLYAIRTFDAEKCKFGTFAYRCVRSRMMNAVTHADAEKHKPLNNSVPITDSEAELEPSTALSPENILIGSENMNELISDIKKVLSTFESDVFDLYIEGLNYREIAKKLGVPTKSVDNALWRIKEKIKKSEGQ